jgi:Na+/H+-dicarboxylate symporter
MSAAKPAPAEVNEGRKDTKDGPRFSSFSVIVAAALAGVASGLFFGEYCRSLSILGNAYIGLLQMTVLPYIVFSLIGNIGRLSIGESKRLAVVSLCVLALLWAVGAVIVMAVPFALPKWDTGSFFSTSLIDPVKEVDFLQLFIPSNPFQSLAQATTAVACAADPEEALLQVDLAVASAARAEVALPAETTALLTGAVLRDLERLLPA